MWFDALSILRLLQIWLHRRNLIIRQHNNNILVWRYIREITVLHASAKCDYSVRKCPRMDLCIYLSDISRCTTPDLTLSKAEKSLHRTAWMLRTLNRLSGVETARDTSLCCAVYNGEKCVTLWDCGERLHVLHRLWEVCMCGCFSALYLLLTVWVDGYVMCISSDYLCKEVFL